MRHPGNKINSGLNGEWAKHVRVDMKRHTSKLRRGLWKEELSKIYKYFGRNAA